MLGNGTRRIPVAKQEDDPYSIVVEFFRIGNSSLNVARAKADDVFARKGANVSIIDSILTSSSFHIKDEDKLLAFLLKQQLHLHLQKQEILR